MFDRSSAGRRIVFRANGRRRVGEFRQVLVGQTSQLAAETQLRRIISQFSAIGTSLELNRTSTRGKWAGEKREFQNVWSVQVYADPDCRFRCLADEHGRCRFRSRPGASRRQPGRRFRQCLSWTSSRPGCRRAPRGCPSSRPIGRRIARPSGSRRSQPCSARRSSPARGTFSRRT